MIKIIFHSNQITERGDSTNAESLSLALKMFYDIESIIVYNKESKVNNPKKIEELISRGYDLIPYIKPGELHDIGKNFGATHSYFFCGGEYSPLWIKNTKRLSHVMFNNFEPHGDKYNYVSEWLYSKAIRNRRRRTPEIKISELQGITGSPFGLDTSIPISWVPHIVESIKGDGVSFRKKLKIPIKAKVIGRIGGYSEFNDPAAQKGVVELVEKFHEYYFVFVNTRKFYSHPRIKYVDYLSSREKWDFYAAGDVFINGRLMGESFGFSICEALSVGKPVVAPNFHRNLRMDKHHISILTGQGLLYKSKREFKEILIRQINSPVPYESLTQLVDKFNAKSVIKMFADKFLDLEI